MKKAFLLAMFLSVPVAAQELKVADGSSSGTYAQMLKEIAGVCGDVIHISEVQSSGAIENLDKLIGNEANAAFMHSDVLFFRSKTEDLSNLRTLLALYPEDVHFVALNRPYKEQGLKSLVGRGRALDAIADLSGLPVGAAGGGCITAQVIRLQGEIAYNFTCFDSGKEVLAALEDGRIAAAVFVGAAPLPNLKELGRDYKLLEIGESTAAKLKSVYRPTTITYTKMGANSVPTVAPDCLLVTRVYKTPKFVNALRQFRQCFVEKLDELKETTGTHKAWQKVDVNNHGQWEWYKFSKETDAQKI